MEELRNHRVQYTLTVIWLFICMYYVKTPVLIEGLNSMAFEVVIVLARSLILYGKSKHDMNSTNQRKLS